MTFTNIKKRVASNIGYVDSSGNILTSRDITETDIGNWVNDRYLDDLVAALATQYPEDFTQEAVTNFYKTSSTISSITDTTLVIDDANFNNAMVGDRVYNSTDGSYEEIASYTNTTTVTLDAAQADWSAGDTVYVLGTEFALGGDATDARDVLYVGVKYDADNEKYTTCHYRDYNQLNRSGNEEYSPSYPVWYNTSSLVSSVPTKTIGIRPEAEENVANGIKIRYVAVPDALSDDSDVPNLPLTYHSTLVSGATADALKKMLRFEDAMVWEQKYQLAKVEMLATYATTRASTTPRMRPSRNLRQMLDRRK